ncbi:ribosome biogenesis GTPase YqeH [Companilactobacillus sp. RD055328]|uniref:ribosome biogenesis GTPase YqeH n=1 Tax=Companilactobacillus sp. RD055328 TaxID=2916634 RepID=UPI001FC850C8|nr:ribosome biogenesis GTPase YqeH [Companilactobacillus sp. RD055328]GKQ42511.1 ribosome biogenesis GTPase YqeH [Companilactobacillus sp. RD055328]
MDNNQDLYCVGCGAKLQTTDKKKAGFLPENTLNKYLESDEQELYCQRCFRLRNYNDIMDVDMEDSEFIDILNKISDEDALVVNLIDIFDYNGSVIPGIHRFIGNNEMILVANKEDLLPKSVNRDKLKRWFHKEAQKDGLNPVDEILISAKKNTNLDDLLTMINKHRGKKDVYIVGTTNVGKSTLVNSIISMSSDIKNLVTTSRFPGTTLDRIEIPLDDGAMMIDTPGIIHRYQLAHFLNEKELKEVTPSSEIKPKVYQLRGLQTLFIAGLARIDFVDDIKTNAFVYVDNNLLIHRTKLEKADEFYEKHQGDILNPPFEPGTLPEMNPVKFTITEKSDIVIAGLGWVTVQPGITIKAYAPKGVEITLRKAIV